MSEKVVSKFDKTDFVLVLKGSVVALVVSVLGILLFATVLKFASLSDFLIKVVNQIIKILSVMFGVIATKKSRMKGIVRGLLIGILYTLFAYASFSILSKEFGFGLSLLFDCLFSGVFGSVFGILFANIKR